MCQSPIIIANRSRRYCEGLSKRHFSVSCGHCYECQKRLQDDWFVRAFFEYQRIKNNGSCWFPTLSYKDDTLPWYIDNDYPDPLDESKSMFVRPCFSNKDIKRFRDRLRVYLTRAGYDSKNLRFFVACELGGKYGRPHYHVLLFLPFRIPFKKFFAILKKAWPLGRVMFSANYGMLVQSDKAVQYCCKYVSKESTWFRNFGLDKYLNDLVKKAKYDDDFYLKLLEFRKAYRLHFQSMKFGIDGLCVIDKSMLVDDRINLMDYGLDVRKDLDAAFFAIPSYYRRKLTKVKDSFNTERDSALGLEVKRARFADLVCSMADKFQLYFKESSFAEHLSPLQLPFPETQRKIIIDLLSQCAIPPTPYTLAVYALVYSDVVFATDNKDEWPIPILNKSVIDLRYKMSPQDCLQYLLSHAVDFYVESSIKESEVPTPEHCSRFDLDRKHFDAKIDGFHSLPCFAGYDEFINEVSYWESEIGRLVSDSKFKQDDEMYTKAQIMGIFDTKYSYVFKTLFDL